MAHRRGAIAAAALMVITCRAGAAYAADESSATAYMERLYGQAAPGQDARFTPDIETLWYECIEWAQGDAELCPGINMFTLAPDATLSNIKIEALADNGKHARVKASFNNGKRDVVAVFSLVNDDEEGRMIEEIAADGVSLTDALKSHRKADVQRGHSTP
jgi:hypothetical protein